MRIGIDATAISRGEGSGFQTYNFNLVKNLLTLEGDDDYVVYCRGEVPQALRNLSARAKFKVCRFRRRKVCEQLWLSMAAPGDSLDVFHCVGSLPLYSSGRTVLTVHGLSWRLFPEVFTRALRLYWRGTAERTMRKATRLIAISEWTKRVIVSELGIAADRIDVVYHGVDLDAFKAIDDAEAIRAFKSRYDLPAKYILYLGGIIPVKNLSRLVGAYGRLVRDREFSEYRLVIAGKKGWGYEALVETVKRLGLENNVVFTGFVLTEDLAQLYSAAEVFVLPSLYEGFGIPIIESFACRTPVVTSNASCLPEIAGDAALLFDPQDEEALTEALVRVLRDPSVRGEMIARGLARAREFSWGITARRTHEVYKRAFSHDAERHC